MDLRFHSPVWCSQNHDSFGSTRSSVRKYRPRNHASNSKRTGLHRNRAASFRWRKRRSDADRSALYAKGSLFGTSTTGGIGSFHGSGGNGTVFEITP